MKSGNNKTAKEGRLYTGWVEKSITPPNPVKLQGQFYERISEYVQSPLLVTVLALETRNDSDNSIDQMMIGSCDLGSVSAEILKDVRKNLQRSLDGFDLEKLFICATHTHTAPKTSDLRVGEQVYKYIPNGLKPENNAAEATANIMQPDEYRKFLVERLCEAFTEAWAARKPGQVSPQLSHAVLGHNRRVVYTDGSARMYGTTDTENFFSLEGPVDHGLELLFVADTENNVSGVVINAACPAQILEHKHFISADFWGEARRQLKAKYGENLHILSLVGAAGDQSPRDLIRRGRGEPSMNEVEGCVEAGRRITDTVSVKMASACKDMQSRLIFSHRVLKMELPIQRVTKKEYQTAKREFDAFLASKKSGERITIKEFSRSLHIPGGVLDRYEQQHNSFYSFEMHVVRCGDVVFACNPFELFTEYGLQIKARSPAQQTFIIQLACDKGRYLPTQKALQGGHYSAIAASAVVGPEGGNLLVNQTLRHIHEMWTDSPA